MSFRHRKINSQALARIPPKRELVLRRRRSVLVIYPPPRPEGPRTRGHRLVGVNGHSRSCEQRSGRQDLISVFVLIVGRDTEVGGDAAVSGRQPNGETVALCEDSSEIGQRLVVVEHVGPGQRDEFLRGGVG